MRLDSLSRRLLLSALIASAVLPAYAEDSITPATETKTETRPDISGVKSSMLQAMHIDESAQIAYQDEQGATMDETGFFTKVANGQSFGVIKKKEGGVLHAVFHLETKEQAAESKPDVYKLKSGDAFPTFHLKQLAGGKIGNAQLAGHATLVNFYFAECGPCRAEVKELNALVASHPKMKFLALTFDPAADAKTFVKQTGFAWNIAPDATPLINQLGIKTYPSFALIDAHGKLVAIKQRHDIGENEGDLDKWLAAAQAAPTPQ